RSHLAVWNRLGFPSMGSDAVAARLQNLKSHPVPLFINIGKNATTPLDAAEGDYLSLIEKFSGLADGFVLNISSPNTKGLRELLKPTRLREFLSPLSKKFRDIDARWLLKISPDLEAGELEAIL